MLIKVGKLGFAVYLKKCKNGGKTAYEICDFFNTECEIAFDAGDGKMRPISQFAILHSKELLSVDNMDYDAFLPSFQSTERHDQTINRANWFLLDLLTACDAAEGTRKEKLLNTAMKFSEWIMEASDQELDYPVRLLNRLQTIKRKRELTNDELGELLTLLENSNVGEGCKVGAYLLLGQQHAAEIHFAMLGEKEKENFEQYPIYHFWK